MAGPYAGYDSDVWVSASPSLNTTNESCTDLGAHLIYNAFVHPFWDKTQPLVVQNSPDGSTGWTTVTDYVFHYAIGQVVFNTARTPGVNNFTRISTGYFFNVTQLDASSKWALSLKGGVAKTTPFQAAGGWEQNTPTIKSGSGTVDTFRNDARLFTEMVSANQLIMCQLFVSKTNNYRWQFAARVTGVDPSSDAQNLQLQKLTFICDNDVVLLTS